MRQRLPYSWVSRCLALVLLAAAGLKAHGLAAGPLPSAGHFATAGFQLSLVELEIFLGLWLLWGRYPFASWMVALAVFACFSGASFYLGWIGQSSCRCFGNAQVNPWYAFTLDVTALGALLLGRPQFSPEKNFSRLGQALKIPGFFGIAAALLLGLQAGLIQGFFGSAEAALAFLRGDRLSVQPALVDVGRGAPGDTLAEKVQVANWTGQPVRLIGGTSDCSCIVTKDLPMIIPARETRLVTVQIRLAGKPGMFTKRAVFLTDDNKSTRLSFRLTGRITAIENGTVERK